MARKRHSPESIAAVLRRAAFGIPIAQLARQAGVHENTIPVLITSVIREPELVGLDGPAETQSMQS
jgi:lambda repressor-like predicted transcriptional regulator